MKRRFCANYHDVALASHRIVSSITDKMFDRRYKASRCGTSSLSLRSVVLEQLLNRPYLLDRLASTEHLRLCGDSHTAAHARVTCKPAQFFPFTT